MSQTSLIGLTFGSVIIGILYVVLFLGGLYGCDLGNSRCDFAGGSLHLMPFGFTTVVRPGSKSQGMNWLTPSGRFPCHG